MQPEEQRPATTGVPLDRLLQRWYERLPQKLRASFSAFVDRNRVKLLRRLDAALPGSVGSRYIGQCAVCAREIHVSPELLIVAHNYLRPGIGSNVGGCRGEDAPAYELSCEVTKRRRDELVASLDQLRARIHDLEQGKVKELTRTDWRGTVENVSMGSPKWPGTLEAAISKARADGEWLTNEISRLSMMIDDWRPRVLVLVEEKEREATAEREAKKAQRTAEREKRFSDQIASIQRRLDSAVRRKSPSAIAELVEGAGRKFFGRTRQEVFARIDRQKVFEAFGLDTSTSNSVEPNRSVLYSMMFREIPWPESLH